MEVIIWYDNHVCGFFGELIRLVWREGESCDRGNRPLSYYIVV